MKHVSKLVVVLTVAAAAILAFAATASAWAPEGSATIHPGVITVPALVRLVNPVLQLYWRIALRVL